MAQERTWSNGDESRLRVCAYEMNSARGATAGRCCASTPGVCVAVHEMNAEHLRAREQSAESACRTFKAPGIDRGAVVKRLSTCPRSRCRWSNKNGLSRFDLHSATAMELYLIKVENAIQKTLAKYGLTETARKKENKQPGALTLRRNAPSRRPATVREDSQ